jgi:hypothetical protein
MSASPAARTAFALALSNPLLTINRVEMIGRKVRAPFLIWTSPAANTCALGSVRLGSNRFGKI